MSDAPDRIRAELRAYEERISTAERKGEIADDMARQAFEAREFDTDMIAAAMAEQPLEWWLELEICLVTKPELVGKLISAAIISKLSNSFYEDM